MNNYIKNISSVLGVLFLLHLILFVGQLGVPTESSRWLDETFEIKEKYARSIDEKKVLIIGGSNVLFSLKAETLEKRLGLPVVNCGMHAAFKLEYLFQRFKPLINENDIVVLPLEYGYYANHMNGNITYTDYLLSRDPGYFRNSLGDLASSFFALSIRDILFRNYERFKPSEQKIGKYDAVFLNRNGDKTNTSKSLMGEWEHSSLKTYGPIEVKFDRSSSEVKSLKEFIGYCNRQNIRVIVTFPTTMYFSEYDSEFFKGQIERIKDLVVESNALVVGSPNDFFHSIEYFFDTEYHANDEGRVVSTERLISLIEPLID